MCGRLGVDTLIYPEYLAALQIRTSLKRTWVRQWFEILNGEIIVVGVRIRENARLCGMQLKDFAFTHHNFHVSAIKRGHEIVIPRGDDSMQPGDILYITTLRDNVEDLLEPHRQGRASRAPRTDHGRRQDRDAHNTDVPWRIQIHAR